MAEVREQAKKYPGCKITGVVKKVMKVKGVIYIGFRGNVSIFQTLRQESKHKINMECKINSFAFGQPKSRNRLINVLKPYIPEISQELNPNFTDKKQLKGDYEVRHDIRIFPLEYVHSMSKKIIESYEFTFTKKFQKVSEKEIDGVSRFPGVVFEFEFLPMKSVYTLMYNPKNRVFIDILAVCGGILSIMNILNYLLSSWAFFIIKLLRN